MVPVKMGLDPYGFIGRYQALATRTEPAKIAAEVARILASHQQTRLKMAHGLVASFEESGSYAEAKARAGHLSIATVMPGTLKDRVRAAIQENGQIGDAWGVPEHVESILAGFE